MIILNSLFILEQLSEIEEIIQTLEKYIEEKGIEVDREKVLEAVMASKTFCRSA